jgi:hypothetical protein
MRRDVTMTTEIYVSLLFSVSTESITSWLVKFQQSSRPSLRAGVALHWIRRLPP